MITDGGKPPVGRATPRAAWEALAADRKARLIDVRTRAEWSFVGVPDVSELGQPLWMIEWRSFPEMSFNTRFLDQLVEQAEAETPTSLYFICRSGARSLEAAEAAVSALTGINPNASFFNVEEGFEGDLDENRQRGRKNGWKASGLPWRQA